MKIARDYTPAITGLSLEQLKASCFISASGCWEWEGAKRNGYGYICRIGKRYRLNRVVLVATRGQPTNLKLEACHTCNVKSCINPDHLFWGSPRDNMRQAWADGLMDKVRNRPESLKKKLILSYLKKYPVNVVADMFGASRATLQVWKSQMKAASR